MKGIHKKFDKQLFDQNDPKSRSVVKEFFKKHNLLFKDNTDKYGIDLLSSDETVGIEIERRLVWVGNSFPYDEINLPERKTKFFLKNIATFYVILSKDYSRMGMISGKVIKEYLTDDLLKENSNKFVNNGELFYKIPKNKFKWFNLD